MFKPEHFDSANIGRYINQGGLLEGVGLWVCWWLVSPHAIKEALEHCCAIIALRTSWITARGHLMLAPSRVLHSSSDVQELFGNYRLDYWVKRVPVILVFETRICYNTSGLLV